MVWVSNATPLHECGRTQCRSKGLKKILSGFLGASHTFHSPERHSISYLLREALNINREPGCFDFEPDRQQLNQFFSCEDDFVLAIDDIKRIQAHTQEELHKHHQSDRIQLVRGISGRTAKKLHELVNIATGDHIPYFFHTVTFFNHVSGPREGDAKITIDCPIEWVWSCAYTLKELEHVGSDEEFLVVSRNIRGTLDIPIADVHFDNDIIRSATRKNEFLI